MKERIAAIQGLRGIAALLVVCLHALTMVENYSRPERYGISNTILNDWPILHILGAAGVDLFFVISGLIMVEATQSLHASFRQAIHFFCRRSARIYPMYWLYTALVLVVYWAKPAAINRAMTLDFSYILSSLLLFPYPDHAGNYHPVLIVGWTLLYEMCFYVIFALCLWLSPPSFRLTAVAGTLLGLMALGYFDWLPQSFFGSSLWLEFLYGGAIALIFRSAWRPPKWLLLLVGVLVIANVICWGQLGMFGQEAWRGILIGLPAAGLVWLVVVTKWGSSGWLPKLGDASYSLYLTHFFTQVAVGRLWIQLGLARILPPEILIAISVFLSIVVAQVSYRWLEQPIQSWMRSSRKFVTLEPIVDTADSHVVGARR